jgi:competence protein ComFC
VREPLAAEAGGRPAGAPRPFADGPVEPWWSRVLATAGSALDIAFPPTCVSCLGLVGEGELRYLCDNCARRLVLAHPPHCTTCGYPFFGARAENTGCPHCEELIPVFGEGRTLGLLQGPLRRLVHALKYEGALHVLRDVGVLVRRHAHFREFLDGAVLVPVPLHSRKLRERGYNQAALLADVFAATVPGARVLPLLRRVIDTGTQTRLDRTERQANLKNAFALAARAPVEPAVRHVLVDDVFTTGATLNACASVLRLAGVSSIDVATLGHG